MPLTPLSEKKSKLGFVEESIRNVKDSKLPLSPESPLPSTLQLDKIFMESVSAESSLRLPVPEIPASSPKKMAFPTTIFGIFVAEEELQCNALPKSIIDSLNDEMKWQPFTKPSKAPDAWPDEVQGDREAFVDYRQLGYDGEITVLDRNRAVHDDDDVLCHWDVPTKRDIPVEDFTLLMELVGKRKAHKDIRPGPKRAKWSQQSRVKDFMTSRGRDFEDVSDEQVQGKVMIRNFNFLL